MSLEPANINLGAILADGPEVNRKSAKLQAGKCYNTYREVVRFVNKCKLSDIRMQLDFQCNWVFDRMARDPCFLALFLVYASCSLVFFKIIYYASITYVSFPLLSH